MNQPELGKKIAELRKSKGYTQEELVKKCNLSVRTLQRIESGEVTPRFYTIKCLFKALDLNIEDYSAITEINETGNSNQSNTWLQQIYNYIID